MPPNIEKLKKKKDVKGLFKALKHKDTAIREDALNAILEIAPFVFEKLEKYINDKELIFRKVAILGIAYSKNERALDYIHSALNDPEPNVTLAAMTALSHMHNKESANLLKAFIYNGHETINELLRNPHKFRHATDSKAYLEAMNLKVVQYALKTYRKIVTKGEYTNLLNKLLSETSFWDYKIYAYLIEASNVNDYDLLPSLFKIIEKILEKTKKTRISMSPSFIEKYHRPREVLKDAVAVYISIVSRPDDLNELYELKLYELKLRELYDLMKYYYFEVYQLGSLEQYHELFLLLINAVDRYTEDPNFVFDIFGDIVMNIDSEKIAKIPRERILNILLKSKPEDPLFDKSKEVIFKAIKRIYSETWISKTLQELKKVIDPTEYVLFLAEVFVEQKYPHIRDIIFEHLTEFETEDTLDALGKALLKTDPYKDIKIPDWTTNENVEFRETLLKIATIESRCGEILDYLLKNEYKNVREVLIEVCFIKLGAPLTKYISDSKGAELFGDYWNILTKIGALDCTAKKLSESNTVFAHSDAPFTQALNTLCKITAPISNSLLHVIKRMRGRYILTQRVDKMLDDIDFEKYEFFDFNKQKEIASKELEKRGNPPYNSNLFNVADAWRMI